VHFVSGRQIEAIVEISKLLEIVLPDDRGTAMLEAYFDESERTAGVFCVAGYVFAPQQAKRFDEEWHDLFGIRRFHMVDLVALKEDFKDLKRAEADRLLKEAVTIVKRRISFGTAISCYLSEINALSPRFIRGFGHAYPVCCHMAMTCVGDWLRRTDNHHPVTYFFEQGHEFEGEARWFMQHFTKAPEMKEHYQYHSDTFIGKADARPLQSADLLAWEWAKCQDETIDNGIRHIRQSLRALFEPAPFQHYKVLHLTGEPLKRYLDHIRKMGLEQIAEDEVSSHFPHLLGR
jgi:hypothetical protein